MERTRPDAAPSSMAFAAHRIETPRYRTTWIEAGPPDGPLLIFVHGWPELAIVWRGQIEYFATAGWRCVAPDMRGYGASSIPVATSDYALHEIVADLIELHEALGSAPAVWAGHDWGSPAVWALAAHHAERCRGVVNLCIPYLAGGFTLPNLVAFVDRELYPVDRYPVGQWDYWLYHGDQPDQSARDLEADVPATIATLFGRGAEAYVGKPAPLASLRARGGWFGATHRAPNKPRDESMLTHADYEALVSAFVTTGFRGANAWYFNDDANGHYAAAASRAGRLTLPVLFIHAAWDVVCETVRSRLAEPMHSDCTNLSEVMIAGGHHVMLERPDEVNAALSAWLKTQRLDAAARASCALPPKMQRLVDA